MALKQFVYKDRDEQTKLEMKHRQEEDDLYRKFSKHREEENRRIREEIQDEWERELERLTNRFQQEMQVKKRRPESELGALTLRHQQERLDLEKNMTLRRDKKKESLTRKMLEHERAATAALVEKQSHEMMELITERRSEYMAASSLYLDGEEAPPYPARAPPPQPPLVSKFHIYTDPAEFADVDKIAISVAQEDQKTFTDLVRQLVGRCASDVEKARTIFRWITVKNLNNIHFDDNLKGDSPLGLLRGIKHGTESYHVLFKRLCSYAGLHCVVIKGYSKSAGYQPGVRFEDNRFRNSWNAVYVAGAWRFVQCNWGARHLVNAKDAPKPGNRGKSDSLRLEALVFAGRELEIQFRMSRPLADFMATLHKNGVDEKRLSKYVQQNVSDDIVNFYITFPEEGQYGLDIYTRERGGPTAIHQNGSTEKEKHLLTHCCKYLINSSKRN
ncbi:jg5909 [Pararge aegeria aegeria]|uniref:Jg5909 protein n=1 Tax=Pararge aegeria aegeria TaxID=348720 RepID=A0A8S4RF28_9NEOP|nr:jg5909 [Pararge aegeria aegeria]